MPVGNKVIQFFFLRTQEHVVHKKVVGRLFIDYPDVDAKPAVGTGLRVAHPQFGAAVQVVSNFFMYEMIIFFIDRNVELIPVHRVFGVLVFNGKLVFG